jgi:hypothetical protein
VWGANSAIQAPSRSSFSMRLHCDSVVRCHTLQEVRLGCGTAAQQSQWSGHFRHVPKGSKRLGHFRLRIFFFPSYRFWQSTEGISCASICRKSASTGPKSVIGRTRITLGGLSLGPCPYAGTALFKLDPSGICVCGRLPHHTENWCIGGCIHVDDLSGIQHMRSSRDAHH